MMTHPTPADTLRWVQDMTLDFDPARICEFPLTTAPTH